jgi:diguanylate cyclase (GGDEF)-like protein
VTLCGDDPAPGGSTAPALNERTEHASVRAARQGAWLYLIAGLLSIVTVYLPGNHGEDRPVITIIGLIGISISAAVRLLPWSRWPHAATLSLVAIALALIAVGDRWGSVSPYTYAIYFVVVFCWVGLSQPRLTSLRLAIPAAAAYLAPILTAPHPTAASISSVVPALGVCLMVGETVAWAVDEQRQAMRAAQDARAEADHRSDLLRSIARAAGTIGALDSNAVLQGVVDTLVGLGFDLVNLCMLDDETGTYTVTHASGIPVRGLSGLRSAATGTVALVRQRRTAVAIDDYASHPQALGPLVEAGIRSTVAAPVWEHGRMAAVLLAGKGERGGSRVEDLEAFELLAGQAGLALENARRFEEERRAREVLAEVSLRDELTGVGNRRHAVALLKSLTPGDALVMIDLDHFKDINDADGHSAGDEVLVALGDYLRRSVRDADLVARYGGEEFLVVLKEVGTKARWAAERLVHGWRERGPRTTFSAGVACHRAGQSPQVTLNEADDALYAAKRLGRDRVAVHELDETLSV